MYFRTGMRAHSTAFVTHVWYRLGKLVAQQTTILIFFTTGKPKVLLASDSQNTKACRPTIALPPLPVVFQWSHCVTLDKNLNFIYFTITHGYKLATRWSCWLENKYETFSVRENHWNFSPGWCKEWCYIFYYKLILIAYCRPHLTYTFSFNGTGSCVYTDMLCNLARLAWTHI